MEIQDDDGVPAVPKIEWTPGLKANAYYFRHAKWASNWLNSCHRYPEFIQRWRAATGSWDGKIVVDIGCEVDIARGSLALVREAGYLPLLADAQHLPFKPGFADIVALSSTLHHCDDMAAVLGEAARLVRPGGILVSDHDPQLTAINFKGLGRLLWNVRIPLYRLLKRVGMLPKTTNRVGRWRPKSITGLVTE